MKEFGNTTTQEDCENVIRNHNNKDIFDYHVHQFADVNPYPKKREDMFYENQNLFVQQEPHTHVPQELMDDDSMMRFKRKIPRSAEKNQLFTRMFVAVPDLSNGTFVPSIESRLLRGQDMSVELPCKKAAIAEQSFNRYQNNFTPCMNAYINEYAQNIGKSETDLRVGLHSRDYKCFKTAREIDEMRKKNFTS